MIKIEVIKGDIAQVECDALVNAANNHFWMGSGVAGALKRAGGPEIEAEAMKKGPVEVGEAVITGAGQLKARYVIHAVVMGQDLRTDAEIIRLATRNSLKRAAELGLSCLAFPALGTGIGGFSLDDCARIMGTEVWQHSKEATGISKVIFVLYSAEACAAFERQLAKFKV